MDPDVSSLPSQQPTTFPLPRQINPANDLPKNFLKLHFNILQSTPSSTKWFPSIIFAHQKPVHTSPLPIRATCSYHLFFCSITRIIFVEVYKSWSCSLCNITQISVTEYLLSPNILSSSAPHVPLRNIEHLRSTGTPYRSKCCQPCII